MRVITSYSIHYTKLYDRGRHRNEVKLHDDHWYRIEQSATVNGGINDAANPATYTIETPTINLANPTRAGYDFWFWFVITSYSIHYTKLYEVMPGEDEQQALCAAALRVLNEEEQPLIYA